MNEEIILSVRIPRHEFEYLVELSTLPEGLTDEQRNKLKNVELLDATKEAFKSFRSPLLTLTKKLIRNQIQEIKDYGNKK